MKLKRRRKQKGPKGFFFRDNHTTGKQGEENPSEVADDRRKREEDNIWNNSHRNFYEQNGWKFLSYLHLFLE